MHDSNSSKRIYGIEKLSGALENVLSMYDMGEGIQDPTIKAAFQDAMQDVVVRAFKSSSISVGLDMDKSSFEGLQKAYAATQGWQQVNQTIDSVLGKNQGMAEQLKAANEEYDGWLKNLKALGWQQRRLAEVEEKRLPYLRELARQISSEFDAFVNPMNNFDKAMDEAARQLDDWVASLKTLGYTEAEIAELEKRRDEYLRDLQASLERSTSQDLASRIVGLQFGQDSAEAQLYSLLMQQRNELASLKEQFGEEHYLYQTAIDVQGAELASAMLARLNAERARLAEQEITLLEEKGAGIQTEISASANLAKSFERLTKSVEDCRKSLWTGKQNLTGSRYADAWKDFQDLYKKAMGGDEEAYGQLTARADELLGLGRDNLGDRKQYNDLFYQVDQMLKAAGAQAAATGAKAEAANARQESELEAISKRKEELGASQNAEKSPHTLEALDKAIASLAAFAGGLANGLPKPYGGASGAGQNLQATAMGDLAELNADYWQSGLASQRGLVSGLTGDALTALTGAGSLFAKELAEIFNLKKPRGFAGGGITPANEVFLVGENGPELMASPRQWGVLDSEATRMLAGGSAARLDGEELREISGMLAILCNYLRQVVVKTDQTAWACRKIKDNTDMWNAEGLTVIEAGA